MKDDDTRAESVTKDSWRDDSGQKWARQQERTDVQLGPLGLPAIDALALHPGERVLDVGCGAGQTLLQLAERVGSNGWVTGIDIAEPLVNLARARITASGHAHAGDVQPARVVGATFAFERSRWNAVSVRSIREMNADIDISQNQSTTPSSTSFLQYYSQVGWHRVGTVAVRSVRPDSFGTG